MGCREKENMSNAVFKQSDMSDAKQRKNVLSDLYSCSQSELSDSGIKRKKMSTRVGNSELVDVYRGIDCQDQIEDTDEIGNKIFSKSLRYSPLENYEISKKKIVDQCYYTSRVSVLQERLCVLQKLNSVNTSNFDVDFRGEIVYLEDTKASSTSTLQESLMLELFGSLDSMDDDTCKWFNFQFRWVMWTFASLERRQPLKYLGNLLTKENMLSVLSYRYALYTNDFRRVEQLQNSLLPSQKDLCRQNARIPVRKAKPNVPKFHKMRTLSPLQRCTEINTLVWSICLCISLCENDLTSIHVTDGWWFTPALLDSDLLRLVQKGKIRDDTKVVIFSAGFDSSTGDTTRMILKYNCVRKANDHARLGYVEPAAMTRGLSAKTVHRGAGSVYGIRCRVLAKAAPMTKFSTHQCQHDSTSGGNEDRRDSVEFSSRKFWNLDPEESKIFDNFIEMYEESLASCFESSNDLSLDALLEYIDANDWSKSVIKSIETDDSCSQLTSSQQISIQNTMTTLGNARLQLQNAMIKDSFMKMNFIRTDFHDILMQCCLSGELFWFRYSSHDDMFAIKSEYFITNLNMLYSTTSMKLFTSGKSSTIEITREAVDVNDANVNNHIAISLEAVSEEKLFFERRHKEFTVCEVSSLQCVIVHYTVVENMKISEQLSASELRLYCITKEKIGIYLVCSLPSIVIGKLSWLNVGAPIFIQYGIVKGYDRMNDIFEVVRGDHTSITKGSDGMTELVPLNMLQNEKRRFEAIMGAKKTYISTSGEERPTKARSQLLY